MVGYSKIKFSYLTNVNLRIVHGLRAKASSSAMLGEKLSSMHKVPIIIEGY
jgi:hypothetical protein